MKKNYIHLEVEKQERKYSFQCDPDSPLGEVYDVISQMQKYVIEVMKEASSEKKEENNVDSSI